LFALLPPKADSNAKYMLLEALKAAVIASDDSPIGVLGCFAQWPIRRQYETPANDATRQAVHDSKINQIIHVSARETLAQ
jgi:hypothetical protein